MKGNPRISKKERGLIKGALRRVFSRSDLRRAVIEECTVEYKDPKRPRVTKWGVCADCNQFIPRYLMEVDHKAPVVPVNSSLEEMDANQLVNNLWCEKENLHACCKECHTIKTKSETKQRAAARKAKKANG